jgi:hypothetical protein
MPAYYKYPQYLTQHQDPAFDTIHEPGQATQHSGIYRCEGCGHCIASVAPYPLPPQNHPQHTLQQGRIRWRLIVSH